MEEKLKLEGEEELEEENQLPSSDENGTSPLEPKAPESQESQESQTQETEPVVADESAEHAPEELDEEAKVLAETDPIQNVVEEAKPEPPIKEEDGAFETSIKTFTQDDVDKLVGDTRVKTREKTFRYIYDRYGVKSEEELDSLVANAQRFDTQKEQYESDKANWETERDENSKKLSDMSEQIALMQSQIDPERYEDAKLILKGKGMEVTLENINSELTTHPEWKKEEPAPEPAPAPNPEPERPKMRIKALGNEQRPAPELSEEEEAQKLFKLKW